MSDNALLAIPPVICGSISVIACIYVCVSAVKSGYVPCKPVKKRMPKTMSWKNIQQKLKKSSSNIDFAKELNFTNNTSNRNRDSNHPTMMIDILFWMCVSDGLHAIQIILNWFPLAFNLPFWPLSTCKLLGVMAQFLAIQSPCWHVLLAYNLGYLLCGGSISRLSKQKKYQFIIVNLVPLIATILPYIYNEYGRYENNLKYHDVECWIKTEQWQYMYVVAICLSLIFHYTVIVIAISKWKHYSQSGFDQHFKFVVIKLLRFIVIYTIIRFFPVMNRIWEFSSPQPPPFALICAHHIGISLLGFSNAVIWMINQKQIPYNKSYTDLKDEKNMKRNKKLLKKKKGTMRENMIHGNSGSDFNSYRNTRINSYDTVETTTTDYWISTKATPHVTPQGDLNDYDPYNPYNNPNMNGYNGRGREYRHNGGDHDGYTNNNMPSHLLIHVTPGPQKSNPSILTRKSTFPELDISTPEYEAESTVIWSLDNV